MKLEFILEKKEIEERLKESQEEYIKKLESKVREIGIGVFRDIYIPDSDYITILEKFVREYEK